MSTSDFSDLDMWTTRSAPWPMLIWLDQEGNRSWVDADDQDFAHLGWRSRALLRACLQRSLDRVDEAGDPR